MEVRLTEKGKNTGKVSVIRTIATMEVGEIWALDCGLSPIENVRVNCSRYGQLSGKFFNVSGDRQVGVIEVRRAK